MLASRAYRVRVQCAGCRENIPVNNIMSSLRCYRCAEVNVLDDAFWRDVLERDTSSAVTILGRSQRRDCEVETTWQTACPQCEAGFELAALADPAANAVTCKAGHPAHVWPADPIVLGVFPSARFVVAEPPSTMPAVPGAHLDVLACASCGAPLAMAESSRVIVCDHCSATNVMSDAMSPKSRVFCVVVDDGRPERTEADRHWDLAMTTSNPDKLRALASDPSPKVRKAVADGRLTPVDVLVALTNDPDPVVRKAAAMNPNAKRAK